MALGIRYKLWQMGFLMETSDKPDVTALQKYLDTNDLKKYAEAEHLRWLAYLRTEDNQKMSVEKAEIIAKNSPELMKKLGTSVYLGMHMDMIPLYDISDATKEINRRCFENKLLAPQKDTTDTDEFI